MIVDWRGEQTWCGQPMVWWTQRAVAGWEGIGLSVGWWLGLAWWTRCCRRERGGVWGILQRRRETALTREGQEGRCGARAAPPRASRWVSEQWQPAPSACRVDPRDMLLLLALGLLVAPGGRAAPRGAPGDPPPPAPVMEGGWRTGRDATTDEHPNRGELFQRARKRFLARNAAAAARWSGITWCSCSNFWP